MFEVLDVSDWPVAATEPAGDDPKDWLAAPDGSLWIYKARKENDGWSQGEDWAEKAVGEIAKLLGIPAAQIELVIRDGQHGLVSRDLKPKGWDLQPGSAALYELLQSDIPKDLRRS